jgi:lipid-binding SYLF domain-containing protein
VLKVGFIVGGEYGRVVLLLQDENGNCSNPVFIAISGGSVGFQLGAQSADFVLVFRTKRSVDGAVLQVDDEANAAFYGVKYISPRDIRTRTDMAVPREAEDLRKTVEGYVRSIEG